MALHRTVQGHLLSLHAQAGQDLPWVSAQDIGKFVAEQMLGIFPDGFIALPQAASAGSQCLFLAVEAAGQLGQGNGVAAAEDLAVAVFTLLLVVHPQVRRLGQGLQQCLDLVGGEHRAQLAQQGIVAGLYDVSLKAEFDGMCDRVGSEYWRQVLKEETAKENPRPILAAVTDGHIVGFTGPVDRQENGRGWFTGICTDPLYERRGIAGVLFNDLMGEFIKVGAAYSTLFTGTENHAQRLYLKTGFRPARYFAIMKKTLEG